MGGKPIGSENAKPTEVDLLSPAERKYLNEPYKEFYLAKRTNFIATIQGFPNLWLCFELLDAMWLRGLEDMHRQTDPDHALPTLLFIHAHSKFRTALELAFSCCTGDARNTLRSGIESVVYACKMLREPKSAELWAAKDEGDAQWKAYRKAFEQHKKENLFPASEGLDELHKFYSYFSEWATHTTLTSIGEKMAMEDTPTDKNIKLHHFETDPQKLAEQLFSIILASSEMENAFFGDFRARLDLDPELVQMRAEFEQLRKSTAGQIIAKFEIQPPTIWS